MGWKTVYITTQGATLRCRNKRLEVVVGGESLEQILIKDVKQLVIVGNVTLTSGAIQNLLDYGVDVVFVSYSGRYKGRLIRSLSPSVVLRVEQAVRYSDEKFALEMAKKHVYGKISNSLRVLRKYNWKIKSREVSKAIAQIKELASSLDARSSISAVRGVEGKASAVYFGVFGHLIKNPDFGFAKRTKRPPLDEVNAMLSLGYMLLLNWVESAVNTVGLDPYIGSLHELEQGKVSLALDLLEEFRFAVEEMVLRLVNKRIMSREDFLHNPEDELPVVLSQSGFRKFVGAFGEMLNAEYVSRDGKLLPLKDVLVEQARLVARAVMGTEEYQPFVMP